MRIAVGDLETDPFEAGQMVYPFLSGFYDGSRLVSFWNEKTCIKRFVDFLNAETEPWTIYFHNGGRFDFFYLLDHFKKEDCRIVNGRIIQVKIGIHELRDSFAIMPFPLGDYDKDEIDYKLMRKNVRDKHRDEIMKYFRKDLTSLYELVTAFNEEFGNKLTVGSAAMKELKKFHTFSVGNEKYDATFRTHFFYGGRNQVFKSGIINGDIRIYDVNSMYPFVMSKCLHPIGTGHNVSKNIDSSTVFVVTQGKNYGAFPTRMKDGSLDFNVESGTFHTTIHEFNAALETGCFKPDRIIKTYNWLTMGSFDEFVTHFYEARKKADKEGDEIKKIFYKYILNSSYGKFAQNPNNYFDWFITSYGDFPSDFHVCDSSCPESCEKVWSMAYVHQAEYIIWKRPLKTKSWYNIAIGASITGAARALLLRGIHATAQPLYCDTDSIICKGNSAVKVDNSILGCWKSEGVGRTACIAGKKLYAVFDGETITKYNKKGKPLEQVAGYGNVIKKANKGARLTGAEIIKVSKGEEVESANPVPSFKWDGSYSFTERTIRRTA